MTVICNFLGVFTSIYTLDMEWIIKIGCVFALFAISILLNWQNEREEKERKKREKDKNSKGTRDLFLEILTKMGCQYKLDEGEDNRIFFDYQGEHFFAYTSNENAYLHIWDTCWRRVDLCDIDEVSRVKDDSNLHKPGVTIVFFKDKGGKIMDVHSKLTFPLFLFSSMPDLEDNLKDQLIEYFHARQQLDAKMRKIREQEQKL